MKRKIFYALILLGIGIQFIHNTPNDSDDNQYAIWNRYETPNEVMNTLKSACLDCHSNKTEYPWYTNIQPVGFWLSSHINEGKKHLNFSEFLNRPKAKQIHKMEETIEMIEKGEMPLKSYTYFGLHPNARLSAEDKSMLIAWARKVKDSIGR